MLRLVQPPGCLSLAYAPARPQSTGPGPARQAIPSSIAGAGTASCDDGNFSNDDECTNRCRWNVCGDGFLSPYEECDDGNPDDYDGCNDFCQRREGCGDADANGRITALDAVLALHDSVDPSSWCRPGICDVDGESDVTTTDALLVLRKAVGLPVVLACPRFAWP